MENCKSCKYSTEATYHAFPKDKDGNKVDALYPWPLCENHMMMGLIAGWSPEKIEPQTKHEMYGA